MKNETRIRALLAAASILALSAPFLPGFAEARTISETVEAGGYSVTLKVLPAESFSGPGAEMVRDGGAQPNMLKGPAHPNHHMVAFVAKSGKPVEDARVEIRYRRLSSKRARWITLPVVRMHVAGHGLKTTHYGNNLRLAAGRYEVRVTVNGEGPARFSFSLQE